MKYIKWIFTTAVVTGTVFILYMEFGGKFILSNYDKRTIIYEIRTRKKLPENFRAFYHTVYPNALQHNSWDYALGLLQTQPKRRKCPCYQTAYRLFPTLLIHNKKGLDQFLTTRYIEHHFSQEECLALNFEHFDFLENRKGLSKVSRSLFNKEAKDLKPLEMAEILAIYENPVKNNRHRNPERAKRRAMYFYEIYLNNSKTGN